MSRGGRGFRKKAQELHTSNEDNQNEHDIFTAEVEDDYDALNNTTFKGRPDVSGVDVDDKGAKLEARVKHPVSSSCPADSLDDKDSLNFQDIVQRSISHLELDDDSDDDTAIIPYSKATASLGLAKWGHLCASPPPPVIIYQRLDGSPMLETIWTPKPALPSAPNDQLRFLLWKLQHHQQHQQSQEHGLVEHQAPESSSLPPNARTLEDVERELLNSASSHPLPTGSPRPESPSGYRKTHAERPEGGDFVKPSSPPSSMSGATTNEGATTPAKSGSAKGQPRTPQGPSSDQPRTPKFRFSPGWSAYPPGMQAGPVLPTPVGMSPPHGQMPAHGRMPKGIHPNGFGNRMPLPPRPDLMLGRVMRSQLPLPSNLWGFQPVAQQFISQPQKTGSSHHNQQLAQQSAYGNQGGATFGSPPPGFGNRMPLPRMTYPMLGPSGVMMPPMLVNNPAMRGQRPLPSNLPVFQPGMIPIRFDSQNTGSSHHNQQPAYQMVLGNLGGSAFGSLHDGFGSRVPPPTTTNPMLSPGWVIMPPYSHMSSLNAQEIHGPMPLPSNLPGYQPGMDHLRFETQNSGRIHHYQQHAYQRPFGNEGGAMFGSLHQAGGGVQQQRHPYTRTPLPGTPDYRDDRNGSFHQGGNPRWM